MLTFLLCVGVLVDPIRRLDNFIRLWQEGYTGFVRAMDLLDEVPDITDRADAVELATVRGAIGFRDVQFGYETGSSPILSRLSLDIRPGEFVALVGPSGVGKSTLCALIPRFYDVSAGQVTLDGRAMWAWWRRTSICSVAPWWKICAMAGQTPAMPKSSLLQKPPTRMTSSPRYHKAMTPTLVNAASSCRAVKSSG